MYGLFLFPFNLDASVDMRARLVTDSTAGFSCQIGASAAADTSLEAVVLARFVVDRDDLSVVEASAGTGGAAGIKASDAEDTGLEAVVGEFEPRFVVA